jgi:protein-tyrosine phosphatase
MFHAVDRTVVRVNRWHALSTRLYGPDPDIDPFSWIGDERLAIGNMPTGVTLPDLIAHGITHVVNARATVQTWFSRDLAAEREIFGRDRVAVAPMYDFGWKQPPRRWARAAQFGAAALDDPDARLFIHCHQGRRRSVLVAYAVLRLRGHAPAEAKTLITEHRSAAMIVEAYTDSVERWLATLDQSEPPASP